MGMSEDLFARFVVDPQERNPVRAAQREARRPLPKRFFKEARLVPHGGGFALSLDGKTAGTPLRRPFVLPTQAAGEAVVAEWNRQGEHIDPATMPISRIVNSAIDGVADQIAAVQAELVRFAASDLICYRAVGPAALVALEAAAWDPVLAWAGDRLGASLRVSTGIVFAEQPPLALAAIAGVVAEVRKPIALAALHTIASLLGSTVLALAVTSDFLSAQEGWAAAHVDDDFQMRNWGEDDEALRRKAARWCEMEAAAKLYALTA